MTARLNIQAAVNELLLLPDGDNLVGGLYDKNTVLEYIVKNEDKGGGESVKVPVQVFKQSPTVSNSVFIDAATGAEDLYRAIRFDYKQIGHSDLISEVEIEQSNAVGAAKQLRSKIISLRDGIKSSINTGLYTGDGSTAGQLAGLPSFWLGADYGGVSRTLTEGTKTQEIFASNVAFELASATTGIAKFGGTGGTLTRLDTRWNCTGATIAGSPSAGENAMALISAAYQHTGDTGDSVNIIAVATDVWSDIQDFLNSKGVIQSGGFTRNVTSGNGEDMDFYGAKVIRDRKIPAGQVFGVNTKYNHFASVKGFTPMAIEPEVENYPLKLRTQIISALVSMTMLTTNSVRQFWLEGVNK